MPTVFPNTPGVQINEVRLVAPPIQGASTSVAGFVGAAPKTGRFTNTPRLVTSADQFSANYVLADPTVAGDTSATRSTPLSRGVYGFFDNGGTQCYVLNVDAGDGNAIVAGLKQLETLHDISIIAVPGQTEAPIYQELEDQCFRTGIGSPFSTPTPSQTSRPVVHPICRGSSPMPPAAASARPTRFTRRIITPASSSRRSLACGTIQLWKLSVPAAISRASMPASTAAAGYTRRPPTRQSEVPSTWNSAWWMPTRMP
jgi:hypothetical protein